LLFQVNEKLKTLLNRQITAEHAGNAEN
jgi:hypothetical protein